MYLDVYSSINNNSQIMERAQMSNNWQMDKEGVIYMYHIFFIHSAVDGHLGSFHNLAIVDSSAINIGVHVSLQISILYPLDK